MEKQISSGLCVAVTGAAGFIGNAVIDRILSGALGDIATLRLNDIIMFKRDGADILQGSYADPDVRDRLIGDGVDILFHLASLPGGASEHDPVLGKSANLDGSIALIDAAANRGKPVLVYTSSIAVFGRNSETVNDATALHPGGSYGTHKAMIELYLADLSRRGVIDARCVRPAGIVARPRSAFDGFATAWMSEMFHAATEQRAIAIPARPDAHIWLQSIDRLADNIIHAALIPEAALSLHRAWTLPATVIEVGTLVSSLQSRCGDVFKVEYLGGPTDLPPLDASAALSLGFQSDGDCDALIEAVIAQIAQ